MVDVVGGVKSYLFKRDEATIDNITFKLHYRVSFAVLLSCMALVGIIHTLDNITFTYRVSFAVPLEELPHQEGRGDDRQHNLQAPLQGVLRCPAQLHGAGRDHSYIRQHHLQAPLQVSFAVLLSCMALVGIICTH